MSYIYRIYDPVANKIYIGQDGRPISEGARMVEHVQAMFNGRWDGAATLLKSRGCSGVQIDFFNEPDYGISKEIWDSFNDYWDVTTTPRLDIAEILWIVREELNGTHPINQSIGGQKTNLIYRWGNTKNNDKDARINQINAMEIKAQAHKIFNREISSLVKVNRWNRADGWEKLVYPMTYQQKKIIVDEGLDNFFASKDFLESLYKFLIDRNIIEDLLVAIFSLEPKENMQKVLSKLQTKTLQAEYIDPLREALVNYLTAQNGHQPLPIKILKGDWDWDTIISKEFSDFIERAQLKKMTDKLKNCKTHNDVYQVFLNWFNNLTYKSKQIQIKPDHLAHKIYYAKSQIHGRELPTWAELLMNLPAIGDSAAHDNILNIMKDAELKAFGRLVRLLDEYEKYEERPEDDFYQIHSIDGLQLAKIDTHKPHTTLSSKMHDFFRANNITFVEKHWNEYYKGFMSYIIMTSSNPWTPIETEKNLTLYYRTNQKTPNNSYITYTFTNNTYLDYGDLSDIEFY